MVEEALAIIARHADPRIEGHLAQEGYAHLLSERGAATRSRAEDLALVGAVRADEAAHVLDEPEDADAGLAAEVELLADVEQRDLLRRGQHDGPVDAALAQEAVDAQVLVAGAGRGVDEEEVEVAPLDVLQELLQQAVLLRAPPDHRVVAPGEHELDAHDGQVVGHPDGRPPGRADVDRLGLHAHHLGDAGPAHVRVHHADRPRLVHRERPRQQRRERALSYPSLPAQDQDLVTHAGESR